MTQQLKTILVGTLIGLGGFGVLLFVDWRVAVGVFLCLYGNNIHFGADK